MITGRFFFPELLDSFPLEPEVAAKAAEPSWANNSMGERVTDLLGELCDEEEDEEIEESGEIPMPPVIV